MSIFEADLAGANLEDKVHRFCCDRLSYKSMQISTLANMFLFCALMSERMFIRRKLVMETSACDVPRHFLLEGGSIRGSAYSAAAW